MQPVTRGSPGSMTASQQSYGKPRWGGDKPQETPRGYVTNSGQYEQLSLSTNTTMSEGMEGKTSPALPPPSLLRCSVPGQKWPLEPSQPQQLPPPTAGGPQDCTELMKSSPQLEFKWTFCRSHTDSQPNVSTSYSFLPSEPLKLSRKAERQKQMEEGSWQVSWH